MIIRQQLSFVLPRVIVVQVTSCSSRGKDNICTETKKITSCVTLSICLITDVFLVEMSAFKYLPAELAVGLTTVTRGLSDVGLEHHLHMKMIKPEQLSKCRLTVAAAADDASSVHRGTCYCGQVKLEISRDVKSPPQYSGYCHCSDCRQSHAAALYAVIYLPYEYGDATPVRVTSGDHLINYYQNSPNGVVRPFCQHCGTRLLIFAPIGIGFFPSLFPTFPWKPELHGHYAECIVRSW